MTVFAKMSKSKTTVACLAQLFCLCADLFIEVPTHSMVHWPTHAHAPRPETDTNTDTDDPNHGHSDGDVAEGTLSLGEASCPPPFGPKQRPTRGLAVALSRARSRVVAGASSPADKSSEVLREPL